jgi:hypothetical protein
MVQRRSLSLAFRMPGLLQCDGDRAVADRSMASTRANARTMVLDAPHTRQGDHVGNVPVIDYNQPTTRQDALRHVLSKQMDAL